jgi:hypothetical protein
MGGRLRYREKRSVADLVKSRPLHTAADAGSLVCQWSTELHELMLLVEIFDLI